MLNAELAPGGETLPVPVGAMDRLTGPDGSTYALVIAPDQNVLSTEPIEIVLVTVTAPGEFTLERGAYGTTPMLWEAGAVIYAAPLAEHMDSVESRLADLESRLLALEGGGASEKTLADMNGETLTDQNNEPLTAGE